MKVISLFSGYDSPLIALHRLGINYDLIGWSEIEPHAIAAHNALFPQWTKRNLGDIRNINWNKIQSADLLFYSSPCQDVSLNGKRAGAAPGGNTRSSLLWYVLPYINRAKQKYMNFVFRI